MNNIQFWIWLLVIVVGLISRLRKKTPPEQSRPSRPAPAEDDTSKPMTFEELLEEIAAAKKPKPAPVPYTPVNYDDNLKEEARSLEKTDYSYQDSGRTNEIYERAKQEAFYRPSLEETLKLQDTIVRFGQFKGYQKEDRKNLGAELAQEIRNPGGFKRAFIMSEILQRRF